ncbi:MAG TPA: type III-B CRISPR module RAMP protein Cmr1 [Chitinophagales bacterium]|nr:type III-B CRISPR module RAMP protein Cmr1 [Chitinophagales bacterium]
MHSITFTCETITPMFLSGADGTTPELRAPSIKGAMRFWWRAMNGHLGIEDEKDKDGKVVKKGLRTREGELFGATDRKSSFSIQIVSTKPLESQPQAVLPHKDRSFSKMAFKSHQSFQVIIRCKDQATQQILQHLFPLCCVLGGFGGRMRRGFGSIRITNEKHYPATLNAICEHIEALVPQKFQLRNNEIVYLAQQKPPYPYIESISIGRADAQLTKKIGQATHDVNSKRGRDYGVSVGSANPRFASPVYVSAIQTAKGIQPIITVLHHVGNPKSYTLHTRQINEIQQQLKQAITE